MSTLAVGTIKSVSSAAPVFQNTSGTEMGTLCRAWVNLNGTGTASIRDSFNVSSITDNNTGTYTANFATAFSDSDFAAVVSMGDVNNNSSPRGFETVYNYSSSSVKFDCRDESGSEQDPTVACLIVMR